MKRFTKTEKWSDPWYRNLSPIEKILWIYLCDNCDNAGFIEVDVGLVAFQIGCSEDEIQGALKGLARGLLGASKPHKYAIRTFIKNQGNENLNPKNKAHLQIIRIIEENIDLFPQIYKQYCSNIDEKKPRGFEGASKGLPSPPSIVQSSIGISLESSIHEWVLYVRQSHPDFEKVSDIQIQNSLKAYPDRSNWKNAIDTMGRHYAGADLGKPCGRLENFLYGKIERGDQQQTTKKFNCDHLV